MGTNFYRKVARALGQDLDLTDPTIHIGRRSAAGLYCWDCGISLKIGGIKDLHKDGGEFYQSCPKCGKLREIETLETSAGGRELGFNKSEPRIKSGVASCSSFTWAMALDSLCKRIPEDKRDKKTIIDEYHREYSYNEFIEVLKEFPIWFYDSIGEWFC